MTESPDRDSDDLARTAGGLVKTSVQLEPHQVAILDCLEHSRAYHVRRALALYFNSLGITSGASGVPTAPDMSIFRLTPS